MQILEATAVVSGSTEFDIPSPMKLTPTYLVAT